MLWRPETAALARRDVAAGRLGFVEVIAESLFGHARALPGGLRAVRRSGGSIVPHGVGLGLGGAARPDRRRLAHIAGLAEACGAPLVSEHIAFVRAGRAEAGHLLPVPRTRAALDVLVANAREAAASVPVPLALEPIATLVDWPDAEMTEVAFLSELLDRAPVDLVLDLANLHVNASNRRRAGVRSVDADPLAVLDALPVDRIAYVHAAGGRVIDGRFHDTHADPLWSEVDDLVEELWSRGEPPGLLLERDGGFPGDALVRAELDRLAAATARGRARRTNQPRPSPTGPATSPPAADVLPRSAAGTPARPDDRPSAGPATSPPRTNSHTPTPGRGRARRTGLLAAAPAGPRPLDPTRSADRGPDPGPSRRVRRGLGREQAAFLRALTGGPAPPGLDPAAMAALADVLARKRAHAVAKLVPDLAVTPAFRDRFTAWAASHALGRGGPTSDAARFLRTTGRSERTVAACVAVAAAELAHDRRSRLGLWPRLRVRRTPHGLVAVARLGARLLRRTPRP